MVIRDMLSQEVKKGGNLKELLTFVIESKESDFYRSHFKGSITTADMHANEDADILRQLPILEYKDLISYPFLKRLYRDTLLYTKIIQKGEGESFLIGRTRQDIAEESYPIPGDRPLVAFSSPHEGEEKSIWLYEHNILPLVNEKTLVATLRLAQLYSVDSLWSDCIQFRELVRAHSGLFNKKSILVTDSSFKSVENTLLETYTPKLFLSLPEAGLIGYHCPNTSYNQSRFHPTTKTLVDTHDGMLVITSLINLPTPIIKYKSPIRAKIETSRCACSDTSVSIALL